MNKHVKILLFLVLLSVNVDFVYGQQFTVSSFRTLPNDISAYINPIRDLNNEACALIKVVGSKDFVFSSPLGIVKRKNEVGETWIYLPRGTVYITIKHPQWGILRDYHLPSVLESRMTYEMVLSEPPSDISLINSKMRNVYSRIDTALRIPSKAEKMKKVHIAQPLQFISLLSVGLHSGGPSYGLSFAIMRRHGAYVHFQTDFKSSPTVIGECDKDGNINNSSDAPYYSGNTKNSRYLIFGGAIHRWTTLFYTYEGLGYGKRTLAWEKSDGDYLRNTHYSAKGLSAEVGAMTQYKSLFLSAGMMSIVFKYWEPILSIGYKF